MKKKIGLFIVALLLVFTMLYINSWKTITFENFGTVSIPSEWNLKLDVSNGYFIEDKNGKIIMIEVGDDEIKYDYSFCNQLKLSDYKTSSASVLSNGAIVGDSTINVNDTMIKSKYIGLHKEGTQLQFVFINEKEANKYYYKIAKSYRMK